MLSFAGQSPGSRVSCGVTRDGAGDASVSKGRKGNGTGSAQRRGGPRGAPPIRQPREGARRGLPARGGALYACPREPRIQALPTARPPGEPPASAWPVLGRPTPRWCAPPALGPEARCPVAVPISTPPPALGAPRAPPCRCPRPPSPCERAPLNPRARPRRGSSGRPSPDPSGAPTVRAQRAPPPGGGSAWAVLAGGGRSAPSHCPPSRNPSPRGARTRRRRGPRTLARGPGAELARCGARAPRLGGHERRGTAAPRRPLRAPGPPAGARAGECGPSAPLPSPGTVSLSSPPPLSASTAASRTPSLGRAPSP